MNKAQILLQNANRMVRTNSPTIFTIFGVAGLITTTVMAVRATPLALDLIDKKDIINIADMQSGLRDSREMTKLEIVKLCWRPYLPTIVMGMVSIGCIVSANSVNLKRNAALASLYSVADGRLKEYKDKVLDVVGKNKAEKIDNEIYSDTIKNHPPGDNMIISSGEGDTLMFEVFSGRYLYHDIDKVRRICNDMNAMLNMGERVSLNEYYDMLGLPLTKMGDEMGWFNGLDDHQSQLIVKIGSTLTSDDRPCIVIDMNTLPSEF